MNKDEKKQKESLDNKANEVEKFKNINRLGLSVCYQCRNMTRESNLCYILDMQTTQP